MSVRTPRVRAPEPRGSGGWINVPGSLSLADLRGKVVLLDFWTLCCINCIHIVQELRELEARFAGELVVIGVHSPKFPHEADHEAVVRAVARHRVTHPVIDDPESITWQQYGIRAWPTLVLVDPEGYVVGSVSGEGHTDELAGVIQELVDQAESDGVLRRGALELRPAGEDTGTLAFPGKVAADPAGERIAIADTGHDRVLVVSLASGELLAEHGGFSQPQGVRFDGDALIVCDTVADKVWRVDPDDSRELLATAVKSPWDVVRDGDRLVVCEAGRHRLWEIDAAGARPLAGSGGEDLEDGPAAKALLAQPSGITRTPDGALAFADSETSALRILRPDGEIETLVGLGLFEWGREDGDRLSARLQHPLGVAAAPDGAIYVADTFNSLLRVWRDGRLSTLYVGGLDEPGGLDLLPDGRLLVADTNHHRVVLVDPATATLETLALAEQPLAAALGLGPERGGRIAQPAGSTWRLTLDVDTDGYELDPADGPPIRLNLTAEPPSLLGAGPTSWALDRLPAEVDVALGHGSGRIDADLVAATCSGDVCRVHRSRAAYDVELT